MYNYNVNPIDIRPFMQGMEMSRQRDKEQQLQDLRQRVASGDQSAFKEYSMIDPQGAAAFQALNKPEVPELNAADINEFYKDAKSLYPLLEKGDPRAVIALENMQVKYSGTPFVKAIDGFIQNYQVNPDATLQDYKSFLNAMPQPEAEQGKFAPEVSPLQTDQDTGQQYVVITDRNTGQPKRVDVKGGKALTEDEKDAKLIRVDLIKDAKEVGRAAFDDLKNARSTISNYDEAIKAIDEGASSGAMQRFLPSFRESTIRLNNAAQRLGLNVISATTFGALSEGELRLAMDTAVPTNLEPKELKKWLQERRTAQKKLANELGRMATTLSKGSTTLGEYLEKAGYAEGDLIQDEDNDPLGLF